MIVQFPVDLDDEDAIVASIMQLQAHLNDMIIEEALESAKYDDPEDALAEFRMRSNKYAKYNNDEYQTLRDRLFSIAEGATDSERQWQFAILVLRMLTKNNDPEGRKRLTDIINRSLEQSG